MATFPDCHPGWSSPGTTNEHGSDGVQVMAADVGVAGWPLRTGSTMSRPVRSTSASRLPPGTSTSSFPAVACCFARFLGSIDQSVQPAEDDQSSSSIHLTLTRHAARRPARSVRCVIASHTPSSQTRHASTEHVRRHLLG